MRYLEKLPGSFNGNLFNAINIFLPRVISLVRVTLAIFVSKQALTPTLLIPPLKQYSLKELVLCTFADA